MISVVPSQPPESFVFASSIKEDVWHRSTDSKSYEWWYFDALAAGGKEAILITFLDNFVYSPRYNRLVKDDDGPSERFPALSFTYFADEMEEHTSELQSRENLVCRLLLEKQKKN